MKNGLWVLITSAIMVACSTPKTTVPTQAVQTFINFNQPEAIERIRTREQDGWAALNNRYVIYTSRRHSYLLEFRRECKALTNRYDQSPDLRLDQGSLRARVDTLRGCMISHMYKITTDQRTELKNLGKTPAS